jgi:hypothetical protein
VNKTNQYSNEKNPSAFKFQIASDQPVVNASLFVRRYGWRGFVKHPLKNIGGLNYVISDTPKILQSGNLEYCVAVESGGKEFTFPGGVQNTPGKWDFVPHSYWSLKILGADESIDILNAARDKKDFVFPHYDRLRRHSIEYLNGSRGDETSLSIHISSSGKKEVPFGFQLNISDLIKTFADQLDNYRTMVLKARSENDSVCNVGVNLILSDGKSYGADILLKQQWREIEIPITSMLQRSTLLLPNSYPLFLQKKWEMPDDPVGNRINLRLLDCIQVVLDPDEGEISKSDSQLEIESIILKK